MGRPPEPRGEQDRLRERSPWIVSDPKPELLTNTPAGVRHPAREGGRVTDVQPVAGRLTVENRSIWTRDTNPDVGAIGIPLANVIHARESYQTINETTVDSLSVRHLRPRSNVQTTEISVWDDREHEILCEFVTRYYAKQKREIEGLDLTDEQLKLLVTLYSGGGLDIPKLLQRSTDAVAALFEPLREAGLISSGGMGGILTGRGYMLVNEELDDEALL
ncbi:hypothetical protein EGH24_07855 [Halonotius terrestris]|uniref:Uncharacterized protein n=1 Tax=Halonotius terrestris TaxID=2487750 RepID=A0A8J8TBK8_9EURY|nr:CheF family chemotaxis protein [Halonotius terrestris]TQQ81052.1 hypothetical protein EGH24_07855 [Halonotius terrestris]